MYNELCKRISPNMERDGILSVAVAVMMVVVAYLSTHIFSGRAAFLLTGAVMATAMSANVFFWIIPGQRRMVAAMKAGETRTRSTASVASSVPCTTPTSPCRSCC